MGFFKPAANTATDKSIARLHQLIWALIYAGLLTLVLGLFVRPGNDALGWSMVAGGAALAAIGAVLIYVRSRMRTGP